MKIGHCVFNINNIKVNSMADNASINFGTINMKEFSVENKNLGVNSSIGEQSQAKASMDNYLNELNKQEKQEKSN